MIEPKEPYIFWQKNEQNLMYSLQTGSQNFQATEQHKLEVQQARKTRSSNYQFSNTSKNQTDTLYPEPCMKPTYFNPESNLYRHSKKYEGYCQVQETYRPHPYTYSKEAIQNIKQHEIDTEFRQNFMDVFQQQFSPIFVQYNKYVKTFGQSEAFKIKFQDIREQLINSYGNIGLKYQFKIHADYRILTNLIRNADTGKDSKELKTTRAYNEKYQMASIKETNKENKSIQFKYQNIQKINGQEIEKQQLKIDRYELTQEIGNFKAAKGVSYTDLFFGKISEIDQRHITLRDFFTQTTDYKQSPRSFWKISKNFQNAVVSKYRTFITDCSSGTLPEPSIYIDLSYALSQQCDKRLIEEVTHQFKKGHLQYGEIILKFEGPMQFNAQQLKNFLSGIQNTHTYALSFEGTCQLKQQRNDEIEKFLDIFLGALASYESTDNTILKKLSIKDNFISQNTFDLLAQVINKYTGLKELDISGMQIGNFARIVEEIGIPGKIKMTNYESRQECCVNGRVCECLQNCLCSCLCPVYRYDYEEYIDRIQKGMPKCNEKLKQTYRKIEITNFIEALSNKTNTLDIIKIDGINLNAIANPEQINQLLSVIGDCQILSASFKDSLLTDQHSPGIKNLMMNSGRLMYIDLRGTHISEDVYQIIYALIVINPFIMCVPMEENEYNRDIYQNIFSPKIEEIPKSTQKLKQEKEKMCCLGKLCCLNPFKTHKLVQCEYNNVIEFDSMKPEDHKHYKQKILEECRTHQDLPYEGIVSFMSNNDDLKIMKLNNFIEKKHPKIKEIFRPIEEMKILTKIFQDELSNNNKEFISLFNERFQVYHDYNFDFELDIRNKKKQQTQLPQIEDKFRNPYEEDQQNQEQREQQRKKNKKFEDHITRSQQQQNKIQSQNQNKKQLNDEKSDRNQNQKSPRNRSKNSSISSSSSSSSGSDRGAGKKGKKEPKKQQPPQGNPEQGQKEKQNEDQPKPPEDNPEQGQKEKRKPSVQQEKEEQKVNSESDKSVDLNQKKNKKEQDEDEDEDEEQNIKKFENLQDILKQNEGDCGELPQEGEDDQSKMVTFCKTLSSKNVVSAQETDFTSNQNGTQIIATACAISSNDVAIIQTNQIEEETVPDSDSG